MEENILIPFPSDYDAKLRVSSLATTTEVEVIQSNPNLDVNYFDARDMIADLPRILPEAATPEGVGEVRISNRSKRKLISEIGNYESELKTAYLNAVPYILDVIQKSLLLEEHRDRMKNIEGNRVFSNEEDPNINRIQRLYGAINLSGQTYRLKTTLQVFREDEETGKYHGFEITEIELLSPKLRNMAKPAINVALNNNPISLAKLLNNVELSYEPNVKLLDAMIACHEFAITGNYAKMISVYETARQKRLSTHLVDPLQAIRQAKTVRQTRIMPPTERTKALLQPKPKQNAVRRENKGMKL